MLTIKFYSQTDIPTCVQIRMMRLNLAIASLVFEVLFLSVITVMIRFCDDLSQQFLFKTENISDSDESRIGEQTDPFSRIFNQLLSELFIQLQLTSNCQELNSEFYLHLPSWSL